MNTERIGAQVFEDGGEAAIGFAQAGVDGEQGTAQECEGTDEGGVAAAGVVFAQDGVARPMVADQDGVARPMVADFDAAPMVADGADPGFRCQGVWGQTGDEVAGEGGGTSGLFVAAERGDAQEGAGTGEVAFEGVGVRECDLVVDGVAACGF